MAQTCEIVGNFSFGWLKHAKLSQTSANPHARLVPRSARRIAEGDNKTLGASGARDRRLPTFGVLLFGALKNFACVE